MPFAITPRRASYICPSLHGHAQLVYNMDTQTIQYVWSVSLTSDPEVCAAILEHSILRVGPSGHPLPVTTLSTCDASSCRM
jgi:hypothetical protein